MRPLTGIRVVDASGYLAGPFTTLMLADLGADVVKVEAPGGDPMRRIGRRPPGAPASTGFALVNRDKRGVVLDLHTADGRDGLLAMLAHSDVFVQNWRPGVAERLGLTDDALAAANPELLHLAITGYGPTGPDAGAPAVDAVMQAHTGLCTAGGPEIGPALVKTHLADKVTSVFAAQALLAGLLARERGQGGGRIEISMLDAVAYFGAPDLLETRAVLADEAATPARPAPADFLVRCSDDAVVLAPTSAAQIKRMCAALGHPEWPARLRALPMAEVVPGMMALVAPEVARLPAAECLRLFAEHDVPAARVLDTDGHLAHRQVRHNGTYPEYLDTHVGRMRRARYPGIGSTWSAPEPSRGAPTLGEHDAATEGPEDVPSLSRGPAAPPTTARR